MYDPDRMANPRRASHDIDSADEQISWMNHAIWADDLSDATVRAVRSRYYGELSYIDACLGRILDTVEAGPDGGANTLIIFTAE
jgi:choline-sulfatase